MPRWTRALAGIVALAVVVAGPLAAPAAHGRLPTYRTPGYEGRTKVPRTRPPAGPVARPVALSPAGRWPDVHVDAAGTAHVVWTEDDGDGADVVRYCRLRRAARSCDVSHALRWSKSYGPGDGPMFDVDQNGPRLVVVGDQLVVLSYRYPTGADKPDGSDPSRTVLAWVSDDGGASFSGPAIVGTSEIGGGAVAFGPDDDPTILTINQTVTLCHSCVQAIRPGAFTSAVGSLAAPGSDQAYWGSLALDGQTPVAAFADLRQTTFVRRWSGVGSPVDPATWSAPLRIAGDEPQLAGGPAGVYLVNRPRSGGPFAVRRVTATGAGRAVPVSDADDAALRALAQDPSGRLLAAWVSRGGRPRPGVRLRTSTDGRRWTPAQQLIDGAGAGQLALGAAADGGGALALNRTGGINQVGPLAVVGFGPRTPTGRPGLGGVPGGGDAGATTSCQRIAFGAVRIETAAGCFLKGTGAQARVHVTAGEIDLNGLVIAPDPGVRIMIDARGHTLDSTGPVRALLRGPGVGEIVLWHGALHVRLPTAAAGTAFSFPADRFRAQLKGFGIVGRIDVVLAEGGVRIPVALQLPPYLGGVTGAAELRADSRRGLRLDSLRIEVRQAPIGPVLLRDLRIAYSGAGERWEGAAALLLPPQPGGARLDARVVFVGGAFRSGTLVLTPPFPPGLAIAPGVFLSRIGGGVELDPLTVTLAGQLGALPLTPRGPFAVTVDGEGRVRFGDPVTFTFAGTGRLLDVALADGQVVVTTAGYASLRAGTQFDLGIVAGSGRGEATFDGPRGRFVASIRGGVRVADQAFSGVEALASDAGLAGCYRVLFAALGFSYRWGDDVPRILFPSCDLAAAQPARPEAGAPLAAGATFAVRAGTPSVQVEVDGDGGLPQVVLVAPDGARIEPVVMAGPLAADAPALRAARALALPVSPTRLAIGIAQPQAGTWRIVPAAGAAGAGTVRPAASGAPGARGRAAGRAPVRLGPTGRAAAIAGVRVAVGLAPPTVRARVAGRGRTRTLTWTATRRAGLTVAFFERGRGGTRALGRPRGGGRGRLRFATGDLPGGRREIVALLAQDGVPRLRRTVATYVAPAPPRPRRVRAVRIRRAGGGVVVRWAAVRGAAGYLVRVAVADGRRVALAVGPRRRTARIARVAPRYRVAATVAARTRTGRTGPPARAALRARR